MAGGFLVEAAGDEPVVPLADGDLLGLVVGLGEGVAEGVGGCLEHFSGGSNADQAEISRRVAGDPTILSDCFAQHVAYHKQKFFFELFQPFRADHLPSLLRSRLEGRMLLLGFNVQDRQSLLPFKSSLEPFFAWMSKV